MPKMRFFEDKYGNDFDKPFYEKGKVYDVPKENVERWLKRGGVLVEEEEAKAKAKAKEAKEKPVAAKPVVEKPVVVETTVMSSAPIWPVSQPLDEEESLDEATESQEALEGEEEKEDDDSDGKDKKRSFVRRAAHKRK